MCNQKPSSGNAGELSREWKAGGDSAATDMALHDLPQPSVCNSKLMPTLELLISPELVPVGKRDAFP